MAHIDDEAKTEVVRLTQALVAEADEVAHAFLSARGMHPTDLEALLRVTAAERRGEGMAAGALGQELRLTTGAVTALVDRLEHAGALDRVRDRADRRRVLLATTARGRALADQYSEPLRRRIDGVLDRFSPEDLDVVTRYLAATGEAMAAHRLELASPASTPERVD